MYIVTQYRVIRDYNYYCKVHLSIKYVFTYHNTTIRQSVSRLRDIHPTAFPQCHSGRTKTRPSSKVMSLCSILFSNVWSNCVCFYVV